MKKSAIIAVAAITTMICSGVSAAPLTDYSAGKTAIDLTFRGSDVDVRNSTGNRFLFNKKSSVEWGVTTGLGNNFAIQYNNFNAKTKDTLTYQDAYETDLGNANFKIQEFNLLYKLNTNISLYAGFVKYKLIGNDYKSVTGVGGGNTQSSASSNTINKMQIGLLSSTKIADKTTAYAQVGVASDFLNWKVGVSQEIAPNLEFNIDYRRIEAKKITITNNSIDATIKGLGYGVTYKF